MTGALADNLLGASHPYYPVDLKLPGYVPPLLPFKVVLAIFFSASALLLVVSWIFTGDDSCLMPTDTPGPSENVTAQFTGRQRHFHTVDRILFCWFALTGVIHFVVEGAVVTFADFYKSESSNILFEIWKEYCQADSRYASRDPFTICMEAVTAFVEGPLCFVILYGMLKQKPWRFTLQFAVSLAQFYGDVLYFATSWYDGGVYARPEALYFWFYFIIVNSIWIVVPALVMGYSAGHINRRVAYASAQKKHQ
ncbi:hypothetical protein ABBQ38_014254 [Trebouxia sp. C0009 RCD-2024]